MSRCFTLVALLGCATPAAAQTFAVNTADIPAGSPFNAGFTENVEMLDIDGDGDCDAVWANGGDFGNEQNRIWINRGGLQGATIGNFRDETAQRYPSVLDDSRDVDFVDLDQDGDLDLFISNTSGVVNQSNRFLVNMGGVQGGAEGYYQDQTSTRWIDLGVNNNQTHSSVATTSVLGGGGFIDWSCDTTMVDLDNDGDADLIEATYGTLAMGRVPTRIFQNDGDGYFEEFNPSGFQLANTDIANGDPALWCEGMHQHQTTDTTGAEADIANESISVDAGDLDGDFDLDFVLGDRTQLPRVFQNRSVENSGALGFRDVSWSVFQGPDWAPSTGSYEQDLGDLDNDGDLDIFGANWSNVCDKVLFNDGSGNFTTEAIVANSCVRHNEPDFIDYDNDGWLDTFTSSRTAVEQLYRNLGPSGAYVMDEVTATTVPVFVAQALGGDAIDTDLDGDYDLMLANDLDDPNTYLQNLSGTPDTHAPRIPRLEQAPSRNAGPDPTVVRAHVYDNAAWYIASFNTTVLEYRINAGAFIAVPMRFSGGQLFRGEIPGATPGTIDYRVVSTDAYGNTGASALASFVIGPCTGDPVVFCTAKTHSNGCVPQIGSSGMPSASAGSGFVITSSNTLPNRSGLLFYSTFGPKLLPYQGGYLCVQSPTVRTPLQNSGAPGVPPCDGQFAFDFNAWIAGGLDVNLIVGAHVWVQYWSRDPAASFQTNRSDGLAFHVCP